MFQKETESNDPRVVPSECCRLDWMVMKFCGSFAPIRRIWWKRRDGFTCFSPVHSSSSWHDGVCPAVYWSTSFLVIWLERNSQSYYKKNWHHNASIPSYLWVHKWMYSPSIFCHACFRNVQLDKIPIKFNCKVCSKSRILMIKSTPCLQGLRRYFQISKGTCVLQL